MKKLIAIFLLAFSTSAQAAEIVDVFHHVKDNKIIFDFKIEDGWHILAQDPGEIGLPTTITIEGVNKESDQWSKPKTFKDEMFTQYGYENSAQYIINTSSPPQRYSAKISWLACKGDECHPQEKTVYYNTQNDIKNFWHILLMGFIGGLILNFMPCIFPILSLKAISLIQSAKKAKNIRIESLLYCFGVLSSFLIVASILVFLRNAGEDIGWGFQLQSPVFVGFLILVFIIIFLMLLDIINLKNPFANKVGRISFNKEKIDAFITGFFAVLIASPCTAPFMGIALGYTINQEPYLYYPIFISIALGYALPFTLIGFFPKALHKIMPKSGKWMILLKKLFAIPIFLTIVWLGWVLNNQLQKEEIKDLSWQKYNLRLIQEDIAQNKNVLINFTAKWCITCIINERIAFNSPSFKKLSKDKNISLYKADWTNKDEGITKALKKYKRNSVPLYIYYSNDDQSVLPQILTPNILEKELK